METVVSRAAVNEFKAPKKSLGDIDAEIAAKLISVAADVALIIDGEGVIRDVAFGGDELVQEGLDAWLGRPWIDTVTVESRPKIEELLRDAEKTAFPPRWRQVNHPSPKGPDLPIRYATVRLSDSGRVVAVGRDLRAMAALQQRLVDAQQSMEREYARLRHAETRYRLLFQMAAEPVFIVDAQTLRIVDSNPATAQLLGKAAKRLGGRAFADVFDAESAPAVQTLLGAVQGGGGPRDARARLAGGTDEFLVSASIFRQDNVSHYLVRLFPVEPEAAGIAAPKGKSKLLRVIESLPDGFVVTDPSRLVLTANSAFLELAQLGAEEQARGQNLDQWLGRTPYELNMLVTSLREHGSVRNFRTIVRGALGSVEDVEVSAVAVLNGLQPCFGYTIRGVGWRQAEDVAEDRKLPRSVEQLTELVGRVSLKDLVRESTDVIERLCIEAALELTNDNRASAAEMLGLSRQSLYVKLRRYGLVDLEQDGDA